MKNSIIVSAFIIVSSVLVSCQKNTDCKATVKCIDDNGAALKNTNVLLYAQVKPNLSADVKATGTTDSDGIVTFTFKLPAIFDIKATSSVDTKTLSGTGMIRLEEGKGAEKTVILK